MSGATITLEYPVTVDGATHTTLTMRRPKVCDMRDAQRGGGTNADSEIRLFGNLCEVAPNVIEEIDMADYAKMQKAYEGFLSD